MCKRTDFDWTVRILVVGLVALCAPWASAQTITLTSPFRGDGNTQTAATVVEFDASAIAGGATIVIGGSAPPITIPAMGCAGVACAATGSTTAGDDIDVRRISGTNNVRVTLTYQPSFGPTFCDYTGGTSARTFDFTLTGFAFGAGFGYRIASFMVPSNVSCDIPYARVPGARPSFPPGGAIPKLGRLPLNLVLVLDKSPSMQWTIPGSAPSEVRWDRLKTSAQLFTSVWDVIGAAPPPATVSSEGQPEDRLGLVFFGGTASESPLDGASFFKSRGVVVTPWGAAVTAALAPTTFIGGTSIGAGTVNARSRLDGVKTIEGDTAIVLFTDGEQNTTPCIIRVGEVTTPTVKPYPHQPPGTTYTDNCVVTTAVPGVALAIGGVGTSILGSTLLPRGPIFTIGLGEAAVGPAAQLLDDISQETAGRVRFPNEAPAMDTSFVDSLVDNLRGGTVSLLERTTGSVAAGVAQSAPMAVLVDPSLTRIAFVLGWDGRPHQEVSIEIRRPDGTVVSAPLNEANQNSRVAAVNLPADGPDGSWQARVVRHSAVDVPLRYHLTAYGVESRLNFRGTESSRIGTGQAIRIATNVGWDDNGLADLPSGAIRATIERPPQNLGTILHDSVVREPVPVRPDTSPLAMKFDQLAREANLLEKIRPQALPASVVLASVGHGRYEGTFDGANVGGGYRIRLDYDWTDPRTGRIRRKEIADRHVAVLPTADDSIVEVERKAEETEAVVLITPRDRFGNYVGPGFENEFSVQSSAGTVVRPVSDPDVRGTYTIRITGLAPTEDPRVRIDYRGLPLRDEPLSQLPGGGGGARSALWLALGSTFPHGSFGNDYKRDLAGNIGYEHAISSTASIEATLGIHQFKPKAGASDLDVTQVGVNGKFYFAPGTVNPFATVGIGAYVFDPGSTRFGGYAGLGVQVDVSPRLSLEGRWTLHGVADNSPNSTYSTVMLGLRYAF